MGLIIVIASSRLIDLLICVYLRKSVVQLKPGSSFRRSIDRLYIDCDIDAVCPIVSVGAISGRKYAPLHDSPKQQPYAIACGAIRGKPFSKVGSGGED